MGVTQLWQILGPVEQHQPLASLEGLTLAVDLSIWVCETQSVKQMQGVVSKPFLRNLFFRISHLTQLGVKLVFVIEGSAPELKWEVMMKRQQSRFPSRQGKPSTSGKQTRKNFNACLRECCELLEILGIPYVQSKGEAEAMCALLDASGLVDGCITNDGDAFLYGARTVFRNFTMNSKDPHVEAFKMSDIESMLGIDRSGLVGLGLLLGCDFVPKGVPGIGMANATKLIQSLRGKDILNRLRVWTSMSESECVDQVEILARRKALSVPDFPQTKVINEFLVIKDRCPSRLSPWKRPVPDKLQEFALLKLEWPMVYTLEKVLPLVTLWDMQDLLQSKTPSTHQHLKPNRIVKARVRQGIPCYEVEWHKPVTDTTYEGEYYVTVEIQDLFAKCHPDVVKMFETVTMETKKKKKPSKGKKKKTTEVPVSLDQLSFNFGKMNIDLVTNKINDSFKDLHPSFTEYNETLLATKVRTPKHNVYHQPAATAHEEYATPGYTRPAIEFNMNGMKLSHTNIDEDVDLDNLDEEAYIPLCQRVNMRLKQKQQKQNNVSELQKVNLIQTNGVYVESNGALETSISKKKKRKSKSKAKSGIIDKSETHPSRAMLDSSSSKSTGMLELDKSASDNLVAELSNMDSLLDDIDNLSLYKEAGRSNNGYRKDTKSVSEHLVNGGPYLLERNSTDAKPRTNEVPKHRLSTNSSLLQGYTPSSKSFSTTPFSLTRNFTATANSQKMSSPSSDEFCTPMTYIKQTFKGDGNESFGMRNSPISCSDVGDSETFANFQYVESPAIVQTVNKTKSLNKKTEQTFYSGDLHCENKSSHASNNDSLKGRQLRGTWVTEKINEIVTDNGEKFSFDLNQSINGTSVLPTGSAPKTVSEPRALKDKAKLSTTTTPGLQRNDSKLLTTPLQLSEMDISNLSQYGNFQIQHSLLNSLCGSLMQALTPKGMPLDEYENLRASLEKIQSEQNRVLGEFGNKNNEDVVCNIDFAKAGKAPSKLNTPLNGAAAKSKTLHLNQSGLDIKSQNGQQGNTPAKMTKTAKKKLRKSQKLLKESLNNTSSKENVTNTDKASVHQQGKSNTKTAKASSSQQSQSKVKTEKESNDQQSKTKARTEKESDNQQSKAKTVPSQSNKQQNNITCTSHQSNNQHSVSTKLSFSSEPVMESQKKSKRQKKAKKESGVNNEQLCELDAFINGSFKKAQEKNQAINQQTETQSEINASMAASLESTGKKKSKNKKNKHKDKEEVVVESKVAKTLEKRVATEVPAVVNLGENETGFLTQNICTPEETDNTKKKKKKRKKKKVKQASPLIDFSADETFFVESQSQVCAEYLKKALEPKSNFFQSQSSSQKIEKASPLMDLSADDTLLELEALSTVVTDSQFDAKTREKLKVAYQKTLVKQRLKTSTVQQEKTVGDKVESASYIGQEPVLSLSDVFRTNRNDAMVETVENPDCRCADVESVRISDFEKNKVPNQNHISDSILKHENTVKYEKYSCTGVEEIKEGCKCICPGEIGTDYDQEIGRKHLNGDAARIEAVLFTNGKSGMSPVTQNGVSEQVIDDRESDEEYLSCEESESYSVTDLTHSLVENGLNNFQEVKSSRSSVVKVSCFNEDFLDDTEVAISINSEASNKTVENGIMHGQDLIQGRSGAHIANGIHREEGLSNGHSTKDTISNFDMADEDASVLMADEVVDNIMADKDVDDLENGNPVRYDNQMNKNGIANGHNINAVSHENSSAVHNGHSNKEKISFLDHDRLDVISLSDSDDDDVEEGFDEEKISSFSKSMYCNHKNHKTFTKDAASAFSDDDGDDGDDDKSNCLNVSVEDESTKVVPIFSKTFKCSADSPSVCVRPKVSLGMTNGSRQEISNDSPSLMSDTKEKRVEHNLLHSVLSRADRRDVASVVKEDVASPVSLADRLKVKLRKSTRSVLDSFKGSK